jgi:hypothetical protein
MITSSQLKKELYIAVSKTYLKYIIETTPTKTGMTAEAWELEVNDDFSVDIYNKDFGQVVLYLEEGTDPYVIKPKTKKALRWQIGPGDRYAFAKRVNHPGIEARKFIQTIMTDDKIFREFETELEARLEPYLKAMFKK